MDIKKRNRLLRASKMIKKYANLIRDDYNSQGLLDIAESLYDCSVERKKCCMCGKEYIPSPRGRDQDFCGVNCKAIWHRHYIENMQPINEKLQAGLKRYWEEQRKKKLNNSII